MECAMIDTYNEAVRTKAHLFLEKFYRTFGADELVKPTAIETELYWTEFIPGVDLVAIPDDVTFRDGILTFGEYKTSGTKPFIDQRAYFTIQPIVYKVMLEHEYKTPVEYVEYTFMWPNGAERIRRPLPPSDYWLSYLQNIAVEIALATLADCPPTYGMHCNWCAHRDICNESLMTGVDALSLVSDEEGWQ